MRRGGRWDRRNTVQSVGGVSEGFLKQYPTLYMSGGGREAFLLALSQHRWAALGVHQAPITENSLHIALIRTQAIGVPSLHPSPLNSHSKSERKLFFRMLFN